jgi:LuxR family quorum-sensing system transcriptional regulator CciR
MQSIWRGRFVNELAGEKMHMASRDDTLDFIAGLELQRLGIDAPSTEQVSVMKSMLADRTTLVTRLVPNPSLNKREVACLIWITRGKSSLEIAKILDIKHTTVRSHLTRIKNKLQAHTMPQAVYESIRYSYVQPKILK